VNRAQASLAVTLAAFPDAGRFLAARPGDSELPATVILDPGWLAEQVRLRGEIWGIGDQRTLGTLWWYSASTMLVRPGVLAAVTNGSWLSPRLEHLVIHHRPDSRFSGAHGTELLPAGGLDAFAAGLRSTLATVIGLLGSYVPRPRPLWAIATDAIAGQFLWAGQRTGAPERATAQAARLVAAIGAPMPPPRFTREVPSWVAESGGAAAPLRLRRTSCCLLYRVPAQAPCGDCPRLITRL
jgi:ferric iron reductase protein FhuF